MLFENEPDLRLLLLINHIGEKTKRWIEKQLKKVDLTLPQFGALVALSQCDMITQRELSEMVGFDTTTAMVVCDALEKKILIQRLSDSSDRRVNRLVLTDDGRKAVADVYPRIRDACKEMYTMTSTDEMKTTIQLLEKLYQKIPNLPEVFVNVKEEQEG